MTEGMDALNEQLKKFRIWALTQGRYAPSTTERMGRRIASLSKAFDMLELDEDAVLVYFAKRRENGAKTQTLNSDRKAVVAWARYRNFALNLPRFREAPSPDPWIPTDDEVMLLLKTASKTRERGVGERNRTILELLFFGGIRIGELVKINLDDIRADGIRIRSEKHEPERTVGLPAEMMSGINDYVTHYRMQSDPSALITTVSGRMGYNYARNTIKRIAYAAGVPRFHAHAARHWCATSLLKGMLGSQPLDIRMVQIHLGHLSLRTTQRYTHLKQEEVAREVRKRLAEIFRNGAKMTEPNMNHMGPVGFEPTTIWL